MNVRSDIIVQKVPQTLYHVHLVHSMISHTKMCALHASLATTASQTSQLTKTRLVRRVGFIDHLKLSLSETFVNEVDPFNTPVTLSNSNLFPHSLVIILHTGAYCPAGTKTAFEYPCPAGTYNNRTTADNAFDCLPCPG